MKLLQAGRGGAILLVVGLALLEPARAHVAHRASADDPAPATSTPAPAPQVPTKPRAWPEVFGFAARSRAAS